MSALQRRLEQRTLQEHPYGFRGKGVEQKLPDPRGRTGIFARGKNIYNGGSTAAHHKKGYGMGRPPKGALKRRMSQSAINLGED